MAKYIQEAIRDEDTYELIEAAIIACNRCHTPVHLWSSWANECDNCGTEYNGSGQELAPREFWGEETGERF